MHWLLSAPAGVQLLKLAPVGTLVKTTSADTDTAGQAVISPRMFQVHALLCPSLVAKYHSEVFARQRPRQDAKVAISRSLHSCSTICDRGEGSVKSITLPRLQSLLYAPDLQGSSSVDCIHIMNLVLCVLRGMLPYLGGGSVCRSDTGCCTDTCLAEHLPLVCCC